ncbi:MAG: hypothetical protein J5925_07230, partial [Clostridia bacterium]|nr:hypothetical protein [Clostridia bacterium]
GYFEPESYVALKDPPPEAPYSYVLAGRRFGAVVTHNGLGLTYFDNMRERRIFAFCGDEAVNGIGERLILSSGGKEYDVCACAASVRCGGGKAIYRGCADGADYELEVFVCEKYPVKLMRLKCGRAAKARYEARPVMGSGALPARGVFFTRAKRNGNACVLFCAPLSQTFAEGCGFIGACGGKCGEGVSVCAEGTEMLFFAGACATRGGAETCAALPDREFYAGQKRLAEIFAQSFLPTMRFKSGGAVNDALLNVFLPYQVAACRFFARGAFYQSGGAYGFRDQLQDCLWLAYSLPAEVRTHILRCCAHQYSDGSVMHWWHTGVENGMNRGIRTKCSDDLLYLPLAVAEYCEKTGDTGVLGVRVRYIDSPPLGEHERERYELPVASAECESVYLHCLRALARAATKGAHGLVLMGSCDWNDAFSLLGAKGVGESVFSTMLYVFTAEKFAGLCPLFEDRSAEETLLDTARAYREALEAHAFFGDRYARAFCDDGRAMGAGDGGECDIDILPQAWAAIIGLDGARVRKALDTAFSRLYDAKNGIFKLFDPAFSDPKGMRAGYIRGYPAGVRENGGQYTHGALWGAIGFLKAGMTGRALKVLECADPAKRCGTAEGARLYRLEPYAAAGDVYAGKYAGRGGWSFYTGAAAWYCKTAAEELFGIKLRGRTLEVTPAVPFSAQLRFGDCEIDLRCGGDRGEAELDGRKVSMPFELAPGSHTLFVPVSRK